MSGLLPDLPPEQDWRVRIESKLDALLVAFLGDLKNPGGALGRIERLEADVAQIKANRSVLRQAVTTLVVSVLSSVSSALLALKLLGKGP